MHLSYKCILHNVPDSAYIKYNHKHFMLMKYIISCKSISDPCSRQCHELPYKMGCDCNINSRINTWTSN